MVVRNRGWTPIICVVITIFVILSVNVVVYYHVDQGNFGNDRIENKIKAVLKASEKVHAKDVPSPKKEGNFVQREMFLPVQKKTASIDAAKRILATMKVIQPRYGNISADHTEIFQSVLNDFVVGSRIPEKFIVPDNWTTGSEVLPQSAPGLGTILYQLCNSKIVQADNTKKGTQLKILVTLENGYKALFKPQWYERDTIISGPIYAGKDRHNGEVAAFHLSLLLGFRRVPLTVGRRIDLRREIMPVASSALRQTFYQEGNNTCFYGVCHYCTPADPVCARRDIMEGALILWLPNKLTFTRFAHPWQRSYRKNYVARWEVDRNYCELVRELKAYTLRTSQRLLDVVDTAIFDFLIDNGDRHHFEAPIHIKWNTIFLFDNGKSFGNPNEDHIDILAPLYQCCVLRRKTWNTLLKFRGGILGELLDKTMLNSHIYPVLSRDHLRALDRRLQLVYAAVEVCFKDNKSVLL